ncbi:MAG: polysaccharide deacetylase family protein [Candidatus Thiodiazotropha sp.]
MRPTLLVFTLLIICVLPLAGCSSTQYRSSSNNIIAKDRDFIVLRVGSDDSRTLARRYLRDESLYWVIEDANHPAPIASGQEIIIPLKMVNPTGIEYEGYQTVPILCYHRFGKRSDRMEVTPSMFREQMEYLRENDFRVIPLKDLVGFLKGEQQLPKRAVVLTIDDGHRSIYSEAFPILKEYGFPATVFVYSDYVNNGGLKPKELTVMKKSGLISIQPHSKTHSNLTVRQAGESVSQYQKRVRQEISLPNEKLIEYLGDRPRYYAYPFGDSNDLVIEQLQANGMQLGLTVQRKSNAAFTFPYLLHRTMIFGDRDMRAFKKSLVTFKALR